MEGAVNILEFQESESGTEGIRVEGCTELLASYLLQGELCNAKYLWKRIPASFKSNTELAAVWVVGQKMWLRDMSAFYTTVKAFQWSQNITPIMNQLIESMREKTLRLIGTAYTSIQPQDVATLLGLSVAEAEATAASKSWTMTDGMMEPKEPVPEDAQMTTAEEQLGKLTDFVTFLEN